MIEIILTIDFLRLIIISVFLLIIFCVFFKYFIFKNEINNSKAHKIIGGLAVFIVAIISKNSWILFTSLFIGGLIIASEDFMKFLAAILRTKGDKVSETINALNGKPATQKEVEEKQEEDFIEIKQNEKIEDSPKEHDIKIERHNWLKKAKKVEYLVFNYYNKRFGDRVEKAVRLENKKDVFVADGVLKHDSGKIMIIFEVKFLRRYNHFLIANIIRRTLERIRFMFPDIMIILSIVFEGEPNVRDLDRVFRLSKKYDNFQLVLFKYENGEVIDIVKGKIG